MRSLPFSAPAAASRMKRRVLRKNTAGTGISFLLHAILVVWCAGIGGATSSRQASGVYEVDIVTYVPPARVASATDAAREMNAACKESEGDAKSLSGIEKEEALPALSPVRSADLVKQASEKLRAPEPQARPSQERGMAPELAPPSMPRGKPDIRQGESSYLVALWKSRVRGILDMALKNPAARAKSDLSLKTTYLLRVSREGELLDKRLLVSSGNGAFDRSVQLALENARGFPRPPEALLAGRESVEFPLSFAPSD